MSEYPPELVDTIAEALWSADQRSTAHWPSGRWRYVGLARDRGMDAPQFPIIVCGPQCRGEVPDAPAPPPRPGRLKRWLIARQLGLRCLVCNRRAGYGGRCPNPEHNS